MTSILLTVTGAKARATVSGPLTSGMVGIPVTIAYDDAWNGLTKNLVCRCGQWGPCNGEARTILDIGETATVAHEVMRAGMYLYLGIEGRSTDGKLVMPTVWAECGKIQPGANADGDPSANPTLSIWKQLQAEIKENTVSQERIAAAVKTYLQENPIEAPDSSQNTSGLSPACSALLIAILRNAVYHTDQSETITALENALTSDGEEDSHIHNYTASVTLAATCDTAGIRTYTCACGDTYTEEIPATGHDYANGVCSLCGGADPNYTPEIVLTGISAAYSGGNVAAGTAVNALSGIVVTAHYSDGSTEAVTGYTLSGTIAPGSNTITVTYQEKTATFTVIGVSESEGESEWTIVHTLDSSDISYGRGLIANDGDTDNLAANAQRASYLPFDLAVEYGYIYKFEFTATAENMGIAIQIYNEQAVANNSASTAVGKANCMDAGWCVNGKEIEIPETINNSPVACVRVMFKHNAGGTVADGTITSVVISRKAV